MKRFGFTLVEVNLALVVMALGVLGLVSLYSLGFRENRQSLEDVKGVAFAEATVNQLLAALGSRHVTWENWKNIGDSTTGAWPKDGWGRYAGTDVNESDPKPLANPTVEAQKVFSDTLSKCGFTGSFNPPEGLKGDKMHCGLVIVRRGGKCTIAMRCGNRAGDLLYQPLYYAEVQFQGLEEQGGGTTP